MHLPSAGARTQSPHSERHRRSEHARLIAQYQPRAFAYTILIDTSRFDRHHYPFDFLRRELLGDVRCLVFDARPDPLSGERLFAGRI